MNHDLKPQAEALPDPLIVSPIDLRQFAYFPVDLTHPSFGELALIKSDGGPTIESNLVAACFRCNRSKGKKPLSAWLLL